MARPTSFRLPEVLIEELDHEAAARGTTMTALVSSLLGEGLKTSRFPGVLYRNSPTGREAVLAGGPDIWEVVRDIKRLPGTVAERVRTLSEELEMDAAEIQLALDFYAAYPAEIDEQIATDEAAARRVRQLIEGAGSRVTG